mgnify:FL=1
MFFTLRRDFVYFCGYNFGIAEILLGYYIKVVVELIDKRNAGREIDFHYLVRCQLFKMHDERTQRIAVRRDNNALALAHFRRDLVFKIRNGSCNCVFEALAERKF